MIAAEQKARATYENLIKLADDPDVIAPLKFLRAREIVHYQRFGETLRVVEELIGKKKFYVVKGVNAANAEKPIMAAEKPIAPISEKPIAPIAEKPIAPIMEKVENVLKASKY